MADIVTKAISDNTIYNGVVVVGCDNLGNYGRNDSRAKAESSVDQLNVLYSGRFISTSS